MRVVHSRLLHDNHELLESQLIFFISKAHCMRCNKKRLRFTALFLVQSCSYALQRHRQKENHNVQIPIDKKCSGKR